MPEHSLSAPFYRAEGDWLENEAFRDKTFAARLQAWMAQEMGRTQDIQSSLNRGKANRRQIAPRDLAASLWDGLSAEKADLEPLQSWLTRKFAARLPPRRRSPG